MATLIASQQCQVVEVKRLLTRQSSVGHEEEQIGSQEKKKKKNQ
jgi:hypothetical protein